MRPRLLVVVLAGVASTAAQALELSGTVYCQQTCETAVVRVLALGERPYQPLEALFAAAVEKKVPVGEPWKLEVGELPVRLLVTAPRHATMALDLWIPPGGPLPPVWLPKAQEEKVKVEGSTGKAVVVGRGSGQLGRWVPAVPPTWLFGDRPDTVWLPPKERVDAVAITPSGCFALARREGHAGLVARLRCRAKTVTVVDPHGLPQQGVRVAGSDSPVGTAAVTGADGKTKVWIPKGWTDAKVVALAGERGGWAHVRGDSARIVLRPLENLLLVTAQPYPPLLVTPSWFPMALLGTPWVVPGSGGAVPFLHGADGFLQIQTYGFEDTSLEAAGTERPLGVRLVPQAVVEGRVLTKDGRPAPGVPVWLEETESASILGSRVGLSPRGTGVPVWVSDAQGRVGPFFANPG